MFKDKRPEDEQDMISQIKEAARQGAKEGVKESAGKFRGGKGSALGGLLLKVLLLVLVVMVVIPRLNPFTHVSDLFNREEAVEDHDLTLENHGFLGYTVADFADAIIENESQLKKVEVYEVNLSDVATITKAGLAKLKVFSKCQLITYHGSVVYTVDLGSLKKDNIELDEKNKVVTIYVPRPEQGEINVPSNEIEFGDVEKGLLGFGDIKLSPQESADVQTEAVERMKQKLKENNSMETAERFAKMTIWEIYQPIVNGVAEGYSLEVEFMN